LCHFRSQFFFRSTELNDSKRVWFRRYAKIFNVGQKSAMMTRNDRSAKDRAGGAKKVPAALERQINENLRRLYQQALDEDVPDHLQQLLQRLKDQDQAP